MPSRVPTASFEHVDKTLKGLHRVVPAALLVEKVREHGLAPTDSQRSRIPLLKVQRLTDDLADESRDPLLLVRAFSHLDYRPSFLRRTFLSGALTMSDAIALMQRYMHIGTELGQIEVEADKAHAVLRLKPNPTFAASTRQLDAMLYGVLRTLLSLGLQSVESVLVPHSPPAQDQAECQAKYQAEYQALFPAPVRFSAECYGVRFPAIELGRALGWDGLDAVRVARRERKLIKFEGDLRWTESVETLLAVLLRSGEGNIDRCAALLAVSRRTLQRRIDAEGMSFRHLLERTRKRLILAYLAKPYSCETVALLVGYRQVSQLYRSFRNWFGLSPADYRRQILDGARIAPAITLAGYDRSRTRTLAGPYLPIITSQQQETPSRSGESNDAKNTGLYLDPVTGAGGAVSQPGCPGGIRSIPDGPSDPASRDAPGKSDHLAA